MNLSNLLWWGSFLALGIIFQPFVPGVDLLVAGILVALREQRIGQLCILLPLVIVIQEGTGSLNFGGSLLWYSAVVFLFFAGHWLLESESWLFVFLLSGCLGAAHSCVFWAMARLQDVPVSRSLILDEGILQALLTPVLWQIALLTRRLGKRDETTI